MNARTGEKSRTRAARARGARLRRGQRARRSPGVGGLAALDGAARIVANLVATPLVGQRRLRWGTVGSEATDPLPGDELLPDPSWSYTLAVPVRAPVEAVWPWVAQVGQGRGGFYSYQTLENLVGCQVTNTTRILPEHQHPAVGDEIHLHPTAPPLRVAVVDPPHALVLLGSPVDTSAAADDGHRPERWGISTWQFVVTPAPGGGSRLLTRGRYDHSQDWPSRLAFGRFPIEPISFVMSRRMMLEIARLAEHSG